MLEFIHLKNLGPAPELKLELGPRLNLITGDNGLGKTLLLDCGWWALTKTWPLTWGGRGIVPDKEGASIQWSEHRGNLSRASTSEYHFADSKWQRNEGYLPSAPPEQPKDWHLQGPLVIYLRVDGGVSIHDPLRTGEDFRLPFGQATWGRSNVFQFRERDIWDGLEFGAEKTSRVCEGLIRDVSRWAGQPANPDFEQLATLVEHLAGGEQCRLTHKFERVYVDDARDYPILLGPAGELPVAHAPAGLRRILGLAYLVVWAWREHKAAAVLKKRPPTQTLVLFIDEVESHLHPKWQRTILSSLLRALGKEGHLQLIAATHSPLVLASVEPLFDADQDAWFDLELEQRSVSLRKRPFVRHGEIGNWLVSEAFGLKEPRSLEGEQAIAAAQAVLDAPAPSSKDVEEADRRLRAAGLPDIDPFWVRWGYFKETFKGPPRKAAMTSAKWEPRA